MPAGRPTDYTLELSDSLCEEIAKGQSLRTICKDDRFPCIATVFNWLRTHEEFLAQYEKAKQESADALADEMLDICDNSTNDYMEKQNKDGDSHEVVNKENIQRSRLRVDTRKWLASKLKPKKYGEKVENKVTIDVAGEFLEAIKPTKGPPSGRNK